MSRKFVNITQFESRKMERDGNIDFGFWFDKTNEEKLAAAARMIEVAFQEPMFINKKVNRKIYSARKQSA